MRVRPLAFAAASLAVPVLLAGCYGSDPALRPGGSREVVAELTRHGVIVSDIVVGEPACDDPGLEANALHLTATTADDPEPRDVFVYLFRVRGWEDSAEPVDACQAEYSETLDDDAVVRRVDVPTYRAFGADWSDEMTEAITTALEEASTMGS